MHGSKGLRQNPNEVAVWMLRSHPCVGNLKLPVSIVTFGETGDELGL